MVRKDGRTWTKEEPARQSEYRRLYIRYKKDIERIDGSLDLILKRIDDLRKRVEKLEFSRHDGGGGWE